MSSICLEDALVVHVSPVEGAPGYSRVTINSLEVAPAAFAKAVQKVCGDLNVTPTFESPVDVVVTMIFPARETEEASALAVANKIYRAI